METENTEKRVPLPRACKDFNTAKRLYMEQFGSALVTNNYLLVALAGVSLVAAGLIWLNLKTHQTFENFKPLVIRISDVGRAEALSCDQLPLGAAGRRDPLLPHPVRHQALQPTAHDFLKSEKQAPPPRYWRLRLP